MNVISHKARAPRGFGEAVGQIVGIALAVVLYGATFVMKAVLKPTSINAFAAVARLIGSVIARKPRKSAESRIPQYYGRDYSDFEPATTRCIQFPRIGYMLIWAYRAQGVVRAEVKLDNQRIEAAFGAKTFPLEPRAWSDDAQLEAIEQELVDEAERILKRRCDSQRVQTATTKASGAVKAKPSAPTEAPAAAVVAPRPAAVKPPRAPQPPLAVSGRPGTLPPKPVAARQLAPAKVVNRSQGVLVDWGTFERTLNGDTFHQFAVDVVLDNAGVTNRIWGADLQRALQEAQANRGDIVEVAHHGKSADWSDGDGIYLSTNH